jgi:hypothetical protein
MSNEVGFNINSFIEGSPDKKDLSITSTEPVSTIDKKSGKRGRKKNETEAIAVAATPPVPQTSMSYLHENIPYTTAYQDTNAQLDESILQLNILGGETMQELQMVRASKTLRNKYNIVNDMTNTATAIINAKITAIKEKNKTINDISHLEIARMKELKTQASQEDDTTRIANLYNAFVNTPVGVGPAGLGPNMQDMILQNNNQDLSYVNIGNESQAAWESSLDPAQNRMLLEARGTIDTVVMYDDVTGNRWFEVVDKVTRQPIPNVEKPDSSYIYDLDINMRAGYAKDSNRNAVYPLVVLHGGDNSMSEY